MININVLNYNDYMNKSNKIYLNDLIEKILPNYWTKGNYLHNTKYLKYGKIIVQRRVLVKD